MSWSPAMASLRCAVRTTAAVLARGGASQSGRVAIGAMEPALIQTLSEASTHNLAALTTATAPARRLFSSSSDAPLSSSPPSSSASAPSAPSDASSGAAPPNFDPDLWKGIIPDLSGLVSERYVSDEVLNFKTVAYMDASSDTVFPSSEGVDPRIYKTCPANFKVELTVKLKDLKLSDREQMRLRCLVGSRYNTGRQEVRLVTTRFMNRGHNAQYLVYLLENLVAEARGVRKAEDDYEPNEPQQQQQQQALA